MDFNDTPEEAKFRKEAYDWLKDNAPLKEGPKDSWRASSEEEGLKNKPLDIYKLLIEKIAELKFNLGEFLENKGIFKSRYYIYFYAFLILFGVGTGVGFFRYKINKPIQNDTTLEKPLKIPDKKITFLIQM